MKKRGVENKQRYYDTPVGRLPSVTTILDILHKPGLAQWYGKNGTAEALKLRDAAAERGIALHEYAMKLLSGLKPKRPKGIEGFCKSLDLFKEKTDAYALSAEKMVYSMDGFAGTLDFAGNADLGDGKKFYLLDWKTSKQIHSVAVLQVCAYAMAYMRESTQSEKVIPAIVRLKDTGKYPQIMVVDNWEKVYTEAFMPLLQVFYFLREWKSHARAGNKWPLPLGLRQVPAIKEIKDMLHPMEAA